jgi:hypothetical protein
MPDELSEAEKFSGVVNCRRGVSNGGKAIRIHAIKLDVMMEDVERP